MMLSIKTAQRYLLFNFLFMLVLCLLMVVLYECEWLEIGSLGNDAYLLFLLQLVMEAVSIVAIPVALKMFSIRYVHRLLVKGQGVALLRWGTARINLLCLPLVVNTFLYYQTMWAGFGYLAIILLLCLFFIYPSIDRCESEVSDTENK